MQTPPDHDAIARDLLAALDARRQIACLSAADAAIDNAAAYVISRRVSALRAARGERAIGRKIGFTNRTIWDEYDVHAPIWGNVYDSTVHEIAALDAPFDLARVVEPRIEPEIVFSLARAPEPGMDEEALLECIEQLAHGFEIVQSLFAGWRFQAPDTIAAFGLHGALLIGPWIEIAPQERATWREKLASFSITLSRDGEPLGVGNAANVLGGGPLSALRHLVEVLASDADAPPLAAGEIVSTGTLTRALPIAPGERWSTRIEGAPIPGIEVNFG